MALCAGCKAIKTIGATVGDQRPSMAHGISGVAIVSRAARLRNRPSSEDTTGRAIVLMPGPYDSQGKKVNEVGTYDVFGSYRFRDYPLLSSRRLA